MSFFIFLGVYHVITLDETAASEVFRKKLGS